MQVVEGIDSNMKPANLAPIYAGIYADLAEACRVHGYALAVHGSLARDFDVIAIPWTATASAPEEVVNSICSTFAITRTREEVIVKEHGRLVYTLCLSFGDCFLDFSFMPRCN